MLACPQISVFGFSFSPPGLFSLATGLSIPIEALCRDVGGDHLLEAGQANLWVHDELWHTASNNEVIEIMLTSIEDQLSSFRIVPAKSRAGMGTGSRLGKLRASMMCHICTPSHGSGQNVLSCVLVHFPALREPH